jgi:hypothetical protein
MTPTKRLTSLKIGGHDYAIRYHEAWGAAHSQTLGSVVFERGEILLDTDPCESRRDETLIHEILEVLNYHHELSLPHPHITTLSEGLYQVLVDNDGFWRGRK